MNDKQAKHTPLPWSTLLDEYGRYEIWGDTVDDFVAERVEKKNADFIVLSCNSHDQLIEALKASDEAIDIAWERNGLNTDHYRDVTRKIGEALRAAGVKL